MTNVLNVSNTIVVQFEFFKLFVVVQALNLLDQIFSETKELTKNVNLCFYLPLVIYILQALQFWGSCKAWRIQPLCPQSSQDIAHCPNVYKKYLASSPLPTPLYPEVLLSIQSLHLSLASRAQLPPFLI